VRNRHGVGVVAAAGLAAALFGTGAIATAATSTNGDALTNYGPARVTVPYSRVYAFQAKCAALPCKIWLGQHFYAGHTALRALRELEPGPIEMNRKGLPGKLWATWYVRRDFDQKLLRADLAKYHRLALKLTGKITDAKGGSATAERTVTLVPAPLPVFIAGGYRGRRPSTIDIPATPATSSPASTGASGRRHTPRATGPATSRAASPTAPRAPRHQWRRRSR
jgi:hypothetical protein